MAYTIQPNFNRFNETLSFPTDQLNVVAREKYSDTFGFYQSTYAPYSYMKINKDFKYVIHRIKSTPFPWQPYNSCAWNPQGQVRTDTNEIDPCRLEVDMEHCHDESFDSCFEYFVTFDEAGMAGEDLDADGNQLIQQVVDSVLASSSLGLRSVLIAGGLYDFDNVTFAGETANSVQEAIIRQNQSCKGWLARVTDLAADYSWINDTTLIPGGDTSGKKYTGDPVADLYDEILLNAQPELQGLVDEGGVAAIDGAEGAPVVLVTPAIYRAIASEWKATANAFATGGFKPRITAVDIEDGNRRMHQYYIDNNPVIPISETSQYDRYFAGATFGMFVTAAGNIQLGTNFSSIPTSEEEQIGMAIQKSPVLKDKGKYFFHSAALVASAIADVNYLAGALVYAE